MKTIKKILTFLFIATIVINLSSCGKKGDPLVPKELTLYK